MKKKSFNAFQVSEQTGKEASLKRWLMLFRYRCGEYHFIQGKTPRKDLRNTCARDLGGGGRDWSFPMHSQKTMTMLMQQTCTPETKIHEQGDRILQRVIWQAICILQDINQPENEPVPDHGRLQSTPKMGGEMKHILYWIHLCQTRVQ